jgi:hypothetical protein
MGIELVQDRRIVMTLDAGRTGLKFSASRGTQLLAGPSSRPTEPEDRDACLRNIIEGFEHLRQSLPDPPAAISFAFPGPADYPAGSSRVWRISRPFAIPSRSVRFSKSTSESRYSSTTTETCLCTGKQSPAFCRM